MGKPESCDLTGTVTMRHVGGTSKSAHYAVVISTARGDFILRRQGGNPFRDPALDALVGKRVYVKGTIDGHTLTVVSWEERDRSPPSESAR